MKLAMPHIPEIPVPDPNGLYDALAERIKFHPGVEGWEEHREYIEAQGWNIDAFLHYRNWVIGTFGTTDYIKLMTEHFLPIIPIWDIGNESATEPAKFWNQHDREYVLEEEFLEKTRGPTVAWIHENCKLTTG